MSRLSQFRSSKAGIAERYDALAKGYEQGFQSGYRADIQNETGFSTMNEFRFESISRMERDREIPLFHLQESFEMIWKLENNNFPKVFFLHRQRNQTGILIFVS